MLCRFATSESLSPKYLAKNFKNVDTLRTATAEELSDVDEVGEIIAESVAAFFASEYGRNTIEDLASLGVDMSAEQPEETVDGSAKTGWKNSGRYGNADQNILATKSRI